MSLQRSDESDLFDDTSVFDVVPDAPDEADEEPFDLEQTEEECPPESTGSPEQPILGNGLVILAIVLIAIGGGLAVWTIGGFAQAPPALLGEIGVTPFGVVVAGVLLLALADIRRNQDVAARGLDDRVATTQASLEFLADRAESPEFDTDSLNILSAGLQRLDEKISNLSRATKMYGKPLVDVANRVHQAATHIHEIEGTLGSVVEQVEGLSTRLGSDLAELTAATRSHEPFPVERLDELVAATRKSATMIEELKLELATTPDSKAPIEAVHRAIDAMQREVAEMAVSVGQLQPHTPAAAMAVAATPVAATPVAAAVGPAPAPAPAPAPPMAEPAPVAPAASAPKPAPSSGLAHSIAGKRSTTGKNVLGAIAKLRQMRN